MYPAAGVLCERLVDIGTSLSMLVLLVRSRLRQNAHFRLSLYLQPRPAGGAQEGVIAVVQGKEMAVARGLDRWGTR
jgi:hypothetical protein